MGTYDTDNPSIPETCNSHSYNGVLREMYRGTIIEDCYEYLSTFSR